MNAIPKRQCPAATGRQHRKSISGIDSSTALRTLYHGDPRLEFADAIRAAGIPIAEPERVVTGGGVCRFHVEGDKRGSRNGWAVLFDDHHGAGGAFGHWRSGLSGTWRSGRGRLTPAESKRFSDCIAEERRKREAERIETARAAQQRACKLWAQAAIPALSHPYLKRKRVKVYGIRQLNKVLLIPLRDADGTLWNVQRVFPDGAKRFLTGGRKRGLYHAIGAMKDVLLIAEGYATAASLHETTGHAVAVAFDCGNLEPVARVLRGKYPGIRITICADNDSNTAGNPGRTHANTAARAVSGTVAIPPEPFNDWNDVAAAGVAP